MRQIVDRCHDLELVRHGVVELAHLCLEAQAVRKAQGASNAAGDGRHQRRPDLLLVIVLPGVEPDRREA